MPLRRTLPLLSLLAAAAVACTRQPEPAPAPARPNAAPNVAGAPAGGAPATPGAGGDTVRLPGLLGGAPQPRPYNRVITAAAKTRRGVLVTHLVGERLYFEIPRAELGRDYLLLARAAAGQGRSGNRVVRWERSGNRIYLRQRSYAVTSDTALPIARAVESANFPSIVAALNVESWGPDSAAVVEVTRLFTTSIPEFSGLNGVVPDRTFIERVAAFPTNVVVEAIQTGAATPVVIFGAPAPAPAAGQPQPAATVRMHWSFLRLPDRPMMARLVDTRVGYISTSLVDFGRPEHRSETRRFIHRFRLEKKDPNAEVSDPVKPITFWIDPATPAWLVPFVKRGVEQWIPAYREAGFSNAIEARVAPSASEDADWSPYDARNSVIYWRASTVENATGGQTVDPRSGEIIKAEVNMFHNVQNLLRNWYFVQVAPLDPRAQRLPLPDSLMGQLVEYVVAHEVGHAIGFPHNMKASYTYDPDSIRNVAFLRRMGGHTPTLMDYSRFNYVAQPEDRIPVDLLIPTVGPYDRFAVMWGHKPIPGAKSPDDERATLDRWARMQDSMPWLRFETPDATNDPGENTEAVGDADAVKSTTLALKNLKRVSDMLLPVAERPGEDYAMLRELYQQVIAQWGRYMGHVAAIIGGADTQEKYGTGTRFAPVSKARQKEAMRFLGENAFRVPPYVVNQEVLRRIEGEGVVARVRQAQGNMLNQLMSEAKLGRLVEYEALAGRNGDAYDVGEYLGDVRRGVWGELSQGRVAIDVFRRNLQRAYLEAVDRTINPPPAPATPQVIIIGLPLPPPRFTTDARPLLRGELVELDRQVAAALGRTSDQVSRLHLQDVRIQIAKILDPSK